MSFRQNKSAMPRLINDFRFVIGRRYASHQKTHTLEAKDKGTFAGHKKTRNARQNCACHNPESHYVVLYERLKTKVVVNQDFGQRVEVMKGHCFNPYKASA